MKLKRCLLLALIVLPTLVTGLPGEAQTKTPPPPTLAVSLASARPPDDGGVVLAVDPATVSLPKEAAQPDAGASPVEVAQAYERVTQSFGLVTAVAPPTMTILNTAPVTVGPFVGLPSGQALKLLLGSLSDAQWKMVTSQRGIGPGDLASDDQRALFEDTLPPAPWKVIPDSLIGTVHHDGDDRDLTGDRPQARLRLRLHIGLNLPAVDGKNIVFVSPPTGPRTEAEGGHLYHFMMSFGTGSAKLAGIAVRAEVPNTPKNSDLDFDRKALQGRVPLDGLRTVGDLVTRVAGLTHLEVYADAHYEKKVLTITGKPTSARAADLLRALAFCLTGTYRRVGPAFVLTDDLQGLGTRRQILAEFDGDTQARRKAALDRATKSLGRHSVLDLTPADPDLAFSAAERTQIEADRSYQAVGFVYEKFFLSELSARQQQAVRASTGRDETGASLPPDLTSQVTIAGSALTEWVLPSLDGPIPDGNDDTLFSGPHAPAASPAAPTAPAAVKPLPSWPALMKAIPQRALHVHPRTAKQADADIAAAKALGLNQLWVDAFTNGAARDEPLDEAVKAAQGSGVQVFAVLNLLNWGPKAKADVTDLTIMGETSAQAASREQDRSAQIAADKGETLPARVAPDILVSLFAPAVRETLLSLVTRLAGHSGLAGMVWRETDPPGYTLLPGGVYDNRPALGNTVAPRLAFLRQAHIDPLDLPTSQILLMDTDTSLPLYEGGRYSDQVYAPLEARWRQMRSDANVALLRDLYAAAQSGPSRPLIVVQNRGDHIFGGDWYGTWDAPKLPLPAFVDPWNDPPEGQPRYSYDSIVQARPQSRAVLTRLPLDGLLVPADVNARVGLDVQGIAEQRAKTPKLAWDGFVLESAQEALPE